MCISLDIHVPAYMIKLVSQLLVIVSYLSLNKNNEK